MKHRLSGWWLRAIILAELDILAGELAGSAVALWVIPYSYNWRGYHAIGGEWILIAVTVAAAVAAAHMALSPVFFPEKGRKHGKMQEVPSGAQNRSLHRGGVRGEVLRQGVRQTAQDPKNKKAPAARGRKSA